MHNNSKSKKFLSRSIKYQTKAAKHPYPEIRKENFQNLRIYPLASKHISEAIIHNTDKK